MVLIPEEQAILFVTMQQIQTQKLPKILELQTKVNQGNLLNNFDLSFLEKSFKDTHEMLPVINHHPEYQKVCGSMIHIYHLVIEKALENQSKIN